MNPEKKIPRYVPLQLTVMVMEIGTPFTTVSLAADVESAGLPEESIYTNGSQLSERLNRMSCLKRDETTRPYTYSKESEPNNTMCKPCPERIKIGACSIKDDSFRNIMQRRLDNNGSSNEPPVKPSAVSSHLIGASLPIKINTL